jgi:hypothetical protein
MTAAGPSSPRPRRLETFQSHWNCDQDSYIDVAFFLFSPMSNVKLQRKGGQWKEKQYFLFFSFIFGAGEKASFF